MWQGKRTRTQTQKRGRAEEKVRRRREEGEEKGWLWETAMDKEGPPRIQDRRGRGLCRELLAEAALGRSGARILESSRTRGDMGGVHCEWGQRMAQREQCAGAARRQTSPSARTWEVGLPSSRRSRPPWKPWTRQGQGWVNDDFPVWEQASRDFR